MGKTRVRMPKLRFLCCKARRERMSDRIAGRKAAPTRKPKMEKGESAVSSPQKPKLGDLTVRTHLRKAIPELQRLDRLLLTSEVDPDVLETFRDAINRVR